MISNKPKVSVIISAYNCEKYVKQAIDSVLEQDFTNFEIIIVNDASKDKTKKIIEKYSKDKRIKLINFKKNKGRATALNKGIAKSSGEYICFLDADDIYFKDKLKSQVEYMEKHQKIDMVYGGAKFIGVKGKTNVLDSSKNLRERLKKASKKEISQLHAYGVFRLKGIIASCSVMIRKRVFDKCKLDSKLRNIEDYDLWFQIIGKGFKIKGLNKSFYYYRMHKNQKSKNPEKMKIAKDRISKKIKSGIYFKNKP